ncbi:MAG: hypothetical protein LIR50_03215 [Bacillota bacterium]|nr:hypothetical protein [Bacillota bacterium]
MEKLILSSSNIERVKEFIEKDNIYNLNIKAVMENLERYDLYVDDAKNIKGVFLSRGYFNHIYTKSKGFIQDIKDNLIKKGEYGFSGVRTDIAEEIKKGYNIDWENKCDLYYYPDSSIDTSRIKGNPKDLKLENAKEVDDYYTYRGDFSLKEIENDIINRPSSCIYEGNDLASWVLTHEDNSMGIMYTKEKYRGKNYALYVSLDLTDKILKRGNIPYLHIVEGNNMSPGLALKTGFKKYGKVSWFGIEV